MSAEWLALLLRFLLVVGIYIFLLQVVLVVRRDLVAAGPRGGAGGDAAAPLARLVTIDPARSGLQPGQSLALAGVNAIGRAPANAIQIDDDFVSARHAVISHRDRRWWVEDLGSTNGTFVNGRRIDRSTSLRSGDEVGIGRVRFRIEARA